MNCTTTGIALAVENLSWAPRRERKLIDGLCFSIGAGERLAIVGPNGAGKTTLLRCLYRALKPRTGRVLLGGQDIWTMQPADIARKVAVVLQEEPATFPFSVRDIVLMGRIPWRRGHTRWSEHDRERTAHALEHLGLTAIASRQFQTLSGGEKQRVLVARALAQEPQLLLLDEPSNHLDIRHQLEILDLVKGLGITIVTTLHDINLASGFATRAAVIHNGCMIACGATEAVLTADVISDAFGVDARAFADHRGEGQRFSFSIAKPHSKSQ